MGTMKKLTTSIMASFDWVISQVENHEALVNVSLKEGQEAAARAKVQLSRVKEDGSRMRGRIAELERTIVSWTERAKKLAQESEERALECLRRRKLAEHELKELMVRAEEHSRLEAQLESDMRMLLERLQALKTKRNLMRTRQSRAEALTSIQAEDSLALSEIDDIFERWDTKVTECEIRSSCCRETGDSFEAELRKEEDAEALKVELKEILGQSSN